MVFRGHEITTGTANKGDALITLEITKSDGVKIEITSKVLVKYGQSIWRNINDTLNGLGKGLRSLMWQAIN